MIAQIQTESTGKLEPRDYQRVGISWLYETKRAMLTDHPGVGKTLQAAEAAETPCLVIVPNHLTWQWYDFLCSQYPDQKVVIATGTRKERDAALSQKADWYVINIQMLRSYAVPVDVKTIIFDESHHLRNRTAQQSRAAKALVAKNPNYRVYMLTATPMWKSIGDIWMQLHIMYPEIFHSYKSFTDAFCVTITTPYGPKIVAIKREMRKMLDDILQPIKFGRSYKDIGRQLPEMIENDVVFDLDRDLKKLYTQIKENYRAEIFDIPEEGDDRTIIFNGAGIMHALRQITACDQKIEAIKGLVEDNGKQTLIYMWYRDHAKMVHEAIGEKESVLITGDFDAFERKRRANYALRTGKHIVATQESIREGINLQQLRQVIFGEMDYTPGANYQAVTRVVRDRNDNGRDQEPVLVYYIKARATIDTIIHAVSKRRRAAIKDVVREALI